MLETKKKKRADEAEIKIEQAGQLLVRPVSGGHLSIKLGRVSHFNARRFGTIVGSLEDVSSSLASY